MGEVMVVTEDKMSAVTCATGSAPAYAYLFIKAIADFKPKRVTTDSVFAPETFTKDIPLFLIHGDCDKKVPPQMSVDIYNSKEYGLKTLYLAPESGHKEAFFKNREDYIEKIQTFITENTED